MSGVRRLADAGELLAATGGDAYVRAWVDPARVESTWAHNGGAYAWVTPSRRGGHRGHLTTWGPPESAAALARSLREKRGPELGSVTLPRDADRHLPASYSLRPRNDWEWFVTWDPPPQQAHEDEVSWLDDPDAAELSAFLEQWSPRHDARPGAPGVRRWCAVRAADGSLVAVAAETEPVPSVPHLASIATAGTARGHGYGAAVTAWITRAILAEGTAWVTLGMYSDNDVGRRMYHRLGYRCDHYLTSGGLIVR